jgi:hypothetical protein
VDGAGGFEATSSALREAVQECRLPLSVATFHWTHGYGRILSDQMDREHAPCFSYLEYCPAAFR